jgi:hypothetical protein
MSNSYTFKELKLCGNLPFKYAPKDPPYNNIENRDSWEGGLYKHYFEKSEELYNEFLNELANKELSWYIVEIPYYDAVKDKALTKLLL